jgi:hypothetical protein
VERHDEISDPPAHPTLGRGNKPVSAAVGRQFRPVCQHNKLPLLRATRLSDGRGGHGDFSWSYRRRNRIFQKAMPFEIRGGFNMRL